MVDFFSLIFTPRATRAKFRYSLKKSGGSAIVFDIFVEVNNLVSILDFYLIAPGVMSSFFNLCEEVRPFIFLRKKMLSLI